MTEAWLDCSAGASGDMFLGALVGAGVDLAVMQEAVDALGVEPVRLTARSVERHGLAGVKVDVEAPEAAFDRHWQAVRGLIEDAGLGDGVKARALEAFGHLAAAEAAAHGIEVERVHFHEVGALDSIADIVGAAAGLEALGADRVTASTVTVGSGTTRGSHGAIPLPAPAVLRILSEAGAPVVGAVPYESCTPTGAALIASSAGGWGPMPEMVVERIGVGAGGKDPTERANLLRIVVGREVGAAAPKPVVIETNVDDFDPRLWPGALAALLEAGASDAWLTPILMKKGRPAHTVHVLCRAEAVEAVRSALVRHTTTIGMRSYEIEKYALERRYTAVRVGGHRIGVKIAAEGGEVVNASVEYEDAVAAAAALGRPVKVVIAQATAMAAEQYG
ncbi:nickel pincer cofactor biosynthesis protein LarC [Glycomyces xiaoerkulensis]|uniref:nickel pincer cofactor biosynthesis protein LarC n=1 Tax=Glycomyces xiaoerkulensis TaxID=2038139 RepID=UPI000C25FC72|nr:nickel pincer cofactor biosynthesis protein LarC [Glycomyces xiaoerkulensis]